MDFDQDKAPVQETLAIGHYYLWGLMLTSMGEKVHHGATPAHVSCFFPKTARSLEFSQEEISAREICAKHFEGPENEFFPDCVFDVAWFILVLFPARLQVQKPFFLGFALSTDCICNLILCMYVCDLCMCLFISISDYIGIYIYIYVPLLQV
jgi:hypothetical protein